MPSLLPGSTLPRVRVEARAPRNADLARLDALLLIVPVDLPRSGWRRIPRGEWLRKEKTRRHLQAGAVLTARMNNGPQTQVTVGLLRASAGKFETLQLAGRLLKETRSSAPTRIGAATVGLTAALAGSSLESLAAATFAAAFTLPSFKKPAAASPAITALTLFGVVRSAELGVTRATSEGNNLARWLTALPPNVLTAGSYRERVTELAKREGWRVKFLDTRALKERGAGAFLAVAQGNAEDDAGILHLRYEPRVTSAPAVALVGKGICFDTGGTNLKTHKSMLDMHIDMEGSAVALGTLLALTRMRHAGRIDCWLALTENRIGPRAYKPQDLVTASNGVTIQVIHTDAEGRMVLADTLALASGEQPALIIDFATLTGACIHALTERYSGVFTNRIAWRDALERAGTQSGERVWCFPMDDDYDSDLESTVADVMQCTTEGKGDHIYAARFLSRFVAANIPWVHVDLAAAQRSGGLGHVTSDITGFGVRYAVNLLTEQKLPGAAQRAAA